MAFVIKKVSIESADALLLIEALDRELGGEYSPEDLHTVEVGSFHAAGGVFVVACVDGVPAGCGGLRPIDENEVELKRMYVADAFRGRRLSREILQRLEHEARLLGFERLLIETGDSQLAAIKLYSTSGFEQIAPFGEYAEGDRSVCFGKNLADQP